MRHHPEARSVSRVSDEELEYYGELYAAYDIRAGGIDFETFLANPEYYLAKCAVPTSVTIQRRASLWAPIKRLFGSRSAERPA